nr:carboxypeptidase A2-like [Cherax quadricarinatus]
MSRTQNNKLYICQDRLWRKNRVPNILCHGVDCNRNFDSDFGGAGSSNNPCSDYYSGESAFSERESQAVRGSIEALPDVRMYFSLHSYAQLWLTSYGYTEQLPANYDEQYRVAGVSVRALEAVHGTKYNYGSLANVVCKFFPLSLVISSLLLHLPIFLCLGT